MANAHRLVLAALGAALLASPALAEDDAIRAAQNDLRSAREHLKAAGKEYGGHRQQALDRVNGALADLDAALKVAARKDRQEEKKVQAIDHKINKLENQKKKLGAP